MKILLAILVTLTSFNSFAVINDKSVGCGPGNYVSKKNSMISATTRTVTNGICSLTVLGGTTTGTSGCDFHPIVQYQRPDFLFLASNYEMIRFELAQGKGEYLNTFASMIGCQEGAQIESRLQPHYGEIFKGTTAESAFDSFRQVIKSDSSLNQDCKIVI